MNAEAPLVLILARDLGVATGVQEGLREVGYEAEVEAEIDATNMRAVRSAVDQRRPKAVLHMAFLDDPVACEANADRAFLHNAESVINLAAATLEFEAVPIIWSPAHVLAGASQRGEDGPPQPTSTWTESRVRGEVFLKRAAPRGLILRSGPVLSTGLVTEARRLEDGVTVGSAVVQPVPATWLGRVVYAALEAGLHGVIHVPADGPTRPENEVWQGIAARVGRSAASVNTDPRAGSGMAVLKCERESELGLGAPPDWTEALRSPARWARGPGFSSEASAAPPSFDGGAPQLVCGGPSAWVWVLRPGDARRWTPPTAVTLHAAVGKAFIEAQDDDLAVKGDKRVSLAAEVEVRVTVPETTVIVIVGLTEATE